MTREQSTVPELAFGGSSQPGTKLELFFSPQTNALNLPFLTETAASLTHLFIHHLQAPVLTVLTLARIHNRLLQLYRDLKGAHAAIPSTILPLIFSKL